MKHWATTYTFDNGGHTTTGRPPRKSAVGGGGSVTISSAQDNSAHWSSIIDPFSTHGPAISVHNGSLHAPRSAANTDSSDSATDPVRPGPGSPRPTADEEPEGEGGGRPSAGPKSWYAKYGQSDWYGATVRMANRTPVQMMGYHSERDSNVSGDDGEMSGSDVSVRAAYPTQNNYEDTPASKGVYVDENEQSSRHDCADCTICIGSSLLRTFQRKQKQSTIVTEEYQSLVNEEYSKLVSTKPVSSAFTADEGKDKDEKYDAEAKEAQLRAEAALWDTSKPKPARSGDVPIIDVGKWFQTNDIDELYRLGKILRKASEEVGFYQLVGHEVPPVELNAILAQAKLFHSLPKHMKHELAMDMPEHRVGGVGYLGYGNWKLPSRSNPNQNAAYVVKCMDHRITLDDNRWPEEEVLPGFRSSVERYTALAKGLAKRLLPIYAVALDLPADFFQEAFEDPFFRLRMTHYRPRGKSDGDNASFGIHPHVDTSFITLLLTDGTPGLNIFSRKRNEWIQMPRPPPDAFIVNSGELLRQWSNDRFLSTRHFVTNTTNRDRYSVPFFFTPHSDYRMECLPTCSGPDNPPKYPPFSYNESQGIVQGE